MVAGFPVTALAARSCRASGTVRDPVLMRCVERIRGGLEAVQGQEAAGLCGGGCFSVLAARSLVSALMPAGEPGEGWDRKRHHALTHAHRALSHRLQARHCLGSTYSTAAAAFAVAVPLASRSAGVRAAPSPSSYHQHHQLFAILTAQIRDSSSSSQSSLATRFDPARRPAGHRQSSTAARAPIG